MSNSNSVDFRGVANRLAKLFKNSLSKQGNAIDRRDVDELASALAEHDMLELTALVLEKNKSPDPYTYKMAMENIIDTVDTIHFRAVKYKEQAEGLEDIEEADIHARVASVLKEIKRLAVSFQNRAKEASNDH